MCQRQPLYQDTLYGLFECPKLPFGLTNACSTFQRLMELVLNGLQWQTCLVFIDDIIVSGKTFEEHYSRLLEVLARLQRSQLNLKPEKCDLMEESVLFLGHVVCKDGVGPGPSNVNTILNWMTPKSSTEVRQFMGE